MSFANDIKAKAYNDIVEKTSIVVKEYMECRPRANEMADWSKDQIRDMFFELIDYIEYTDYRVGETLTGAEEEHY